MFKCWKDLPLHRPTFQELVQEFDAMLVSLSDKVSVVFLDHHLMGSVSLFFFFHTLSILLLVKISY